MKPNGHAREGNVGDHFWADNYGQKYNKREDKYESSDVIRVSGKLANKPRLNETFHALSVMRYF